MYFFIYLPLYAPKAVILSIIHILHPKNPPPLFQTHKHQRCEICLVLKWCIWFERKRVRRCRWCRSKVTLIICGSSITFPPPPHPSTFFPPYPLLNLHQVKICDGRVPEIRVSSFSSRCLSEGFKNFFILSPSPYNLLPLLMLLK